MLRTGVLGANWTTMDGTFTCDGTDGVDQTVSGLPEGGAFWNANSFPNDQWAQITLSETGGNSGMGVTVRGSGSAGTATYYTFFAYQTSGRYLRKIINGVTTNITNDSVAPAVNDVMYLEIQGTTLVAKVNGTTIFTQTDSSISSGSAGIGGFNACVSTCESGKNWSGGDFLSGSVPRKTAGVF